MEAEKELDQYNCTQQTTENGYNENVITESKFVLFG